MAVFVLDKHKKPLMPCTEKRARLLLERGRARVHKLYPFTIRLVDRLQEESTLQPSQLKLDPGSKTTGVAVVVEGEKGAKVSFLGEIKHKLGIKLKMDARRAVRKARRNRHTRYRKPRFSNRHPEKCVACGNNAKHGSRYCRPCHEARNFVDNGYRENRLRQPSLQARVDQTMRAVAKLQASLPITAISYENVRFDTQLMQNPNIHGIEYQQGTLYGYEVKEYLLEKFGHECAYCEGKSGDTVLNVEHVIPKHPKHGTPGTDRISNLAISCRTCNEAKDNLQPEEWLAKLQKSGKKLDQLRAKRLPEVMKQLKLPLKDAALMNATRWALYHRLKALDLPVEGGSGGRTKYQRIQHQLPKEHYYDALCVGASTPIEFTFIPAYVQVWSEKGRGNRQMCRTDDHGFPVAHRRRKKIHFGIQTGDLVVADVPKGIYKGHHQGRVLARASGSMDISANGKRVAKGVSYRYLRVAQHNDGWQYEIKKAN
jgi:5-methylcytosine-specific restriction endonuclease McrA